MERHEGKVRYSSASPRTLPVAGLTRWTCWHARQVTELVGIRVVRNVFGNETLSPKAGVWTAVEERGH